MRSLFWTKLDVSMRPSSKLNAGLRLSSEGDQFMKYERECDERRGWAMPLHLVLILVLTLAFTTLPAPVRGQQVTAAILGRVVDSANAPIINAKVTAKDEARGTIWTTETNSEGVFNLPRVPVGSYEIRVESKGFRTALRTGIQ